jgi:hypothetical protein
MAPVEDGLLGDGRPHLRIGVAGLSQREAIGALDQSLEEHADLIFVEANVFVIDLMLRGSANTNWSLPTWWSRDIGPAFRRGIDRLRGRNLAVNLAREQLLGTTFKPKETVLAKLYPFQLRDVSDPAGLARVIEKANRLGTRLIFVVPPRSRAAADFMGTENQAEVHAAFEQLAAAYGIELWVFGPAWPNELFGDHAHLNRAGRERFVLELRQRYEDAS